LEHDPASVITIMAHNLRLELHARGITSLCRADCEAIIATAVTNTAELANGCRMRGFHSSLNQERRVSPAPAAGVRVMVRRRCRTSARGLG
jgi:hypothetical protein